MSTGNIVNDCALTQPKYTLYMYMLAWHDLLCSFACPKSNIEFQSGDTNSQSMLLLVHNKDKTSLKYSLQVFKWFNQATPFKIIYHGSHSPSELATTLKLIHA